MNAQLGRDTTGIGGAAVAVDTYYTVYNQGPILSAVNSCIRKYASTVGIYGSDTVRVLERTFKYTLGASFIEDGIANKPFKVFGISSDGGQMYGLDRATATTQMGNSVTLGPFPSLWDLVDDQFWINVPNKNDLLYINGPIAGLTFTKGSDSTNVLEQDRSCICDCATALVADEVGLATGDKWWAKFVEHIMARGGSAPSRVPSQ